MLSKIEAELFYHHPSTIDLKHNFDKLFTLTFKQTHSISHTYSVTQRFKISSTRKLRNLETWNAKS